MNQTVEIKEYGSDRYGRILAVVFLGGKNINLEMIKVGLAEVYRGGHAPGFDSTPYEEAEKEARAENKGMWTQGDKYMSPREWRKKMQGKHGNADETIFGANLQGLRRLLFDSLLLEIRSVGEPVFLDIARCFLFRNWSISLQSINLQL